MILEHNLCGRIDTDSMYSPVVTLAALDISTKKIAIARVSGRAATPWRNGHLTMTEVKVSGQYAADRFDALISNFCSQLHALGHIDRIYIEDISFIPKSNLRRAELDLAKVLGGVRACLVEMGISYALVNNMTWKKGIGLGGRAKKDAIAEHAVEMWGTEPATQDIADALGILEWGAMCYNREDIFKDKGCG